ncbi:uncharacterized protein BDZ83DRAFT_624172 [Colletotrichum acutatum]|uniref:Uncharacterized protein n=1 Tax=Glomerella acutata TaxID=27357 RepID=A0AAD8ULQ9_GLOAC|nr:uncharacterized protein BDZ83DRAFT_624172 [Colletotrichum acutatum]KAK1724099.1 hypothetical protein BDZ83DRAFT_624172 [Colletotrichum acutatum]
MCVSGDYSSYPLVPSMYLHALGLLVGVVSDVNVTKSISNLCRRILRSPKIWTKHNGACLSGHKT